MNPTVIHEIVGIFRSDSHIYDHRRAELYHLLSPLSPEYSIARNLEPYEFYLKVLNQWNSDNGNAATVFNLWEMCKNRGFMAVADRLIARFPNEFNSTSTSNHIKIDDRLIPIKVSPEVRNCAETGPTLQSKTKETNPTVLTTVSDSRLTSRNLKVLDIIGQIVKVDTLSNEDAFKLVETWVQPGPADTTTASFNEDVSRLCKLLYNSPLALHLALAYIREQQLRSFNTYRVSHYVDIYENHKKNYLGQELDNPHRDHKLAILITLQTSIDKIHQHESHGVVATDILHTIAYFESDKIPIAFLENFISGDIEEALTLLKNYHLISSENRLISIHRLVQQFIQLTVFHTAELEIQQLAKLTLTLLPILEGIRDTTELIENLFLHEWAFTSCENYPLMKEAWVHIMSIWKYDCKHPNLLTNFKTVPISIIDAFQPLRNPYDKILNSEELSNFLTVNQSLFALVFGTNATETLELKYEIEYSSEYNYSFNEDVNRFEEIFKRQREFHVEDKDVLNQRTRERFIYFLHHRGDMQTDFQSKKTIIQNYCRDFLKCQATRSCPIDPSTLRVQFVLMQYLKGDCEQLAVGEELLLAAKTMWGLTSSQTLTILRFFGECLFLESKFEKARDILQLFLANAGDGCWRDEAFLASDMLSGSMYCLGDREDAIQILEKAVISWEIKVDEPRKFVEMKCRCETADRLVKDGDYYGALILYQQVQKYISSSSSFVYRRNSYCSKFGKLNWWKFEISRKLASCLVKVKRAEEAITVLVDVLKNWEFVEKRKRLLFVVETEKMLQDCRRDVSRKCLLM